MMSRLPLVLTTSTTTTKTGTRSYAWRKACNECHRRKTPCYNALNLQAVGVRAPDSKEETKVVDQVDRCQYCTRANIPCIFGVSTQGGRM
ncbi:hypothetical protein K435DRAFT_316454 [Dendrothele bispora CBS 962.96]|uniref:Zn(2)-C6 fungal-type domain-containing protein n=1 Tax=Dendrothele bispora (strain CBS 962.96) TaxID=1314807 RepID=A0A4S8LHK5_DENBC|nr:hypothetical protein K435DRAFT_316454 [Dendrothele bispora CBS 962.96]